LLVFEGPLAFKIEDFNKLLSFPAHRKGHYVSLAARSVLCEGKNKSFAYFLRSLLLLVFVCFLYPLSKILISFYLLLRKGRLCIPSWYFSSWSFLKRVGGWFYVVKPKKGHLLFVALIFLVLLRDTTSFYFFLRIGHYVSFGRATTKSILLAKPCLLYLLKEEPRKRKQEDFKRIGYWLRIAKGHACALHKKATKALYPLWPFFC